MPKTYLALDGVSPKALAEAASLAKREAGAGGGRPAFLLLAEPGEAAHAAALAAEALFGRPALPFWETRGWHERELSGVRVILAVEQAARQRRALGGRRIDGLAAPSSEAALPWIGRVPLGGWALLDHAAHSPDGADSGAAAVAERAFGRFAPSPLVEGLTLWRARQGAPARDAAAPSSALILGAGLAGAFMATELARRGIHSIVIDAGPVPGGGASALAAGLAHPHWQADDAPAYELTRTGVERLLALRAERPELESLIRPEGILDLAADEAEDAQQRAHAETLGAASAFMTRVGREEAARIAGLSARFGGWRYPDGAVVAIGALCRTLFEAAGAWVLPNVSAALVREDGGWAARHPGGALLARAPAAVVCAGMASPDLAGAPDAVYGLSPLYGRISLVASGGLPLRSGAATGRGYLVQAEGFAGIGATYEPGGAPQLSPEAAHEKNLEAFGLLFSERPAGLAAGFYEGCRAVPKDRLPIAGRLVDWQAAKAMAGRLRGTPEEKDVPRLPQLWGVFGLGSRGASWGLAAAALAAAQIAGEVPALPRQLERALSPARFAAQALRG